MVNENFCSDKKIWAIFGPFFGPNFVHSRSKIRFSDIFFETSHQICLKLRQKLGTVALNHRMAVLCLGKFLFWPFWPFLGQKYIPCGDIIWFGLFLVIFFQTVDGFLLIFGLSALAVEAYGITLVRSSVRSSVTSYLENRATDFENFLHKATSWWV